MTLRWKTPFCVAGTLALVASAPVSGCSSESNGSSSTSSGTATGTGVTGGGGVGGTATGTGTGSGGNTQGGGGAGGGAATGAGAGVPPPPTEQVFCGGNKLYECGDLLDNDNDGLIDYQDPDCLGPCDNTEDSFYPDLPGGSGQNCDIDCYWDNGLGHDEDCYWDHHCDPHSDSANTPNIWPQALCEWDTANDGSVANQTFPPSPYTCDEMYNSQPQTCIDECKPMAPNGCDCFGCCQLGGEGNPYVWIGTYDENGNGTCDLGDMSLPQAEYFEQCHPCVPVPGCDNPCGHCELCIGKTELPADCYPPEEGGGGSTSSSGTGGSGGSPPQQCPPGVQPCGLQGQDPCPSNSYCITGCCVDIPG